MRETEREADRVAPQGAMMQQSMMGAQRGASSQAGDHGRFSEEVTSPPSLSNVTIPIGKGVIGRYFGREDWGRVPFTEPVI